MSTLGARFDLAPEVAIAFFRAKGLEPTFAWQDMIGQEHARAFTVAKMMDVDLLADVRSRLDEAIATGKDARWFRDQLRPILQEAGWWGKKAVVDPLTGNIVQAELGSPRRLNTIFRTNMQSAYAVGHQEKIERHKKAAPYLMYDAIDDHRTRPAHAALDNTVRPVDDPFWNSYTPPLGWNCRCSVIQLSAEEFRANKLKYGRKTKIVTRKWENPRTGEVIDVPVGVDPGFGRRPDVSSNLAALQKTLDEKTQDLKKQVNEVVPKKPARRARKLSLNQMIAEGKRQTDEIRARLDPEAAAVSASAEFTRVLIERLNEVGRSTQTPAKIATTGEGAELVKAASQRYPDSWTQAADAFGELRALFSKKRGYHYTAFEAQAGFFVDAQPFGRVKLTRGMGLLSVRNFKVAVHEYAHRLQHIVQEADDYFQRLHQRRTKGERLQKLAQLTGKNYADSEVAKEDKYIEPYFGKEYSDVRTPYRGRVGALELMPMVYEIILSGTQPERFLNFFSNDPELFHLAVGLLFKYDP